MIKVKFFGKLVGFVGTAFLETTETYEDSSAISERVARDLATQTVKQRTIYLTSAQEISELVKVGDIVTPDSILCTIEDFKLTGSTNYNEKTLNTLRLLAGNAPRAQYTGVVNRIKLFSTATKTKLVKV